MIKPDRPPYCSFMNIGVFWVGALHSARRPALELTEVSTPSCARRTEILAAGWDHVHQRAHPARGPRTTQNLRLQGPLFQSSPLVVKSAGADTSCSLHAVQVIMHPSNVCEVQIKKERISIRAGQYIMINWFVSSPPFPAGIVVGLTFIMSL